MLIPFKLNSAEMMVKGMDSKIMIATDAHAQLDFFNFCFTDVSLIFLLFILNDSKRYKQYRSK